MPYYEEYHECNGMPFVEIKYEPTVEEVIDSIEETLTEDELYLRELEQLADEYFEDSELELEEF